MNRRTLEVATKIVNDIAEKEQLIKNLNKWMEDHSDMEEETVIRIAGLGDPFSVYFKAPRAVIDATLRNMIEHTGAMIAALNRDLEAL